MAAPRSSRSRCRVQARADRRSSWVRRRGPGERSSPGLLSCGPGLCPGPGHRRPRTLGGSVLSGRPSGGVARREAFSCSLGRGRASPGPGSSAWWLPPRFGGSALSAPAPGADRACGTLGFALPPVPPSLARRTWLSHARAAFLARGVYCLRVPGPGAVAHTCHPSRPQAEEGGSPEFEASLANFMARPWLNQQQPPRVISPPQKKCGNTSVGFFFL